jgi:methylisocitrate lyase
MRSIRDLLESDRTVAAPGVHDAMSAKIAARAGHRALYLGGNAMALGLGKGQPFLTLTETAAITARVVGAAGLPVLVDAGAGFGTAAHLDLAVRELEGAGASAIHIDDQPYPKQADYHRGRGRLIERAEMAVRLETAAAARRDPRFAIVARTDALRVTGSIEETQARCRACVEAGADALMVLDLCPDRAADIRAACPDVPLIWIGGVASPIPTLDQLAEGHFSLACYPFNGIAAVSAALADLWQGLTDNGEIAQSDHALARARADTLELADLPRAWAIEDRHAKT